MATFLPDPTQNICLFWEDFGFLSSYFKVSLAQFLEYSEIVLGSIFLTVTADIDIIHNLDTYSILQLLFENLG